MLEAPFSFVHPGVCPVCNGQVQFRAEHPDYRDSLRCSACGSLPRNRALAKVLQQFRPDWREEAMHESSPGWDPLSKRFKTECPNYIATQFVPGKPLGSVHETNMPCKTFRNEDLEAQTFADASFDIVVTQDVFEHIMHPGKAIAEIARTLKPEGMFICTVPILRGGNPSRRRARMADGKVEHLMPAIYHGNPVSEDGALVTVDWGYDILSYLAERSGMNFMLFNHLDMDSGIAGPLVDVVVGTKSRATID